MIYSCARDKKSRLRERALRDRLLRRPRAEDTEFIDVNKREQRKPRSSWTLGVFFFCLLRSLHFALGPRLSPSASNLSGFASLREISAIKAPKFFTLRREGAKKTHDSKCSRHEPVCAPFLTLEEAFAQKDRNSCRLRKLPDGRCPGAGTQSYKQQHP